MSDWSTGAAVRRFPCGLCGGLHEWKALTATDPMLSLFFSVVDLGSLHFHVAVWETFAWAHAVVIAVCWGSGC